MNKRVPEGESPLEAQIFSDCGWPCGQGRSKVT